MIIYAKKDLQVYEGKKTSEDNDFNQFIQLKLVMKNNQILIYFS